MALDVACAVGQFCAFHDIRKPNAHEFLEELFNCLEWDFDDDGGGLIQYLDEIYDAIIADTDEAGGE